MEEKKLYWNVADLTNWKYNSRAIEADKFEQLKKSLREEGQEMPLLVDLRQDNYGAVLSGNMRLNAAKALGWEKVWVTLCTSKDDADAMKKSLKHNSQYGGYQPEVLAENLERFQGQFDLKEMYIPLAPPVTGEHLLEQFGPSENINPEVDIDQTDDKLKTYLEGNIRQIVLYFNVEQYNNVIERIERLRAELGLDDNTLLFMKLLESYESLSSHTEAGEESQAN